MKQSFINQCLKFKVISRTYTIYSMSREKRPKLQVCIEQVKMISKILYVVIPFSFSFKVKNNYNKQYFVHQNEYIHRIISLNVLMSCHNPANTFYSCFIVFYSCLSLISSAIFLMRRMKASRVSTFTLYAQFSEPAHKQQQSGVRSRDLEGQLIELLRPIHSPENS